MEEPPTTAVPAMTFAIPASAMVTTPNLLDNGFRLQ